MSNVYRSDTFRCAYPEHVENYVLVPGDVRPGLRFSQALIRAEQRESKLTPCGEEYDRGYDDALNDIMIEVQRQLDHACISCKSVPR